ncbi:alpha-L-rhamnosidase-related protein [Yinghuangia aomiensis]
MRPRRGRKPGRWRPPTSPAWSCTATCGALGTFSCADERINRLHEIAEWSFRGNACDIPTDCPQRERAGWTGTNWMLYVPTADVPVRRRGFLGEVAARLGRRPVGRRLPDELRTGPGRQARPASAGRTARPVCRVVRLGATRR